ncbi:MAG: DNA gyrase subunit A, partial [Gammaproteobacteria bacterium HGW-Gammaproteobacteria-5]
VIAIQTSARNGKLVGAIQLDDAQEILLISDRGTLVRTRASEVSQVGRNTQGVTLIRLGDGELLSAIERLDALDDNDEGEAEDGNALATIAATQPAADDGEGEHTPDSKSEE